jgi:hypothetical protein
VATTGNRRVSAFIAADVLVIGAGAAGLMCAIEAGKRGRSVILLDHAHTLAEKIRISGGGRCNFTNLSVKPDNYLSHNPHFCRSALARYTPQHFIALMEKHGLHYHEKTLGQLFCDEGSTAIIQMLKSECEAYGVQILLSCDIAEISHRDSFQIRSTRGTFRAPSLVIATGGLSIPKIGASPFGYQIAEQFGLPMTKLHAGLVPLSVHPEHWANYAELAGISLLASVRFGKQTFRENLLFTHRGLSGPAILQISSYWQAGESLQIDLLPEHDLREILPAQRSSRMLLDNFLSQYLPHRFAEIWCEKFTENKPLNQYSEKALLALAALLHNWTITPSGTLGYTKAEVTCGGVDTQALSSKTMETTDCKGLYFIGEVMDVTGQLGGYNFHWAWASGVAAGQAV